jgi:elongation factor 3
MAAALKIEVDALVAQIGTKGGAQAALEGLAQVAQDKGAVAEPFLVAAFPKVLEATGDKAKNVKDAAVAAGRAIMEVMSPFAVDLVLPALLAGLGGKAKPTQKEATCQFITSLAARAPTSVGYLLVSLVSPVADLTCDIKKEVAKAAVECMTAICACTGNKDQEPFLPFVIEAASSIKSTHKCVERLAGCIFVQNVETPALAAMLPVLSRGLSDKSEEVVRTCCQIVDNMCKVVEDPAEVLPVMPRLEPLVTAATERIADPEARGVAEKALKTLKAAAEGAEPRTIQQADALAILKKALGDKAEAGEAFEAAAGYVAGCAATAANMRNFDAAAWAAFGSSAPFSDVVEEIRTQMEVSAKPAEEVEEEDDEGVDLYKGSFSLAYGTLTSSATPRCT